MQFGVGQIRQKPKIMVDGAAERRPRKRRAATALPKSPAADHSPMIEIDEAGFRGGNDAFSRLAGGAGTIALGERLHRMLCADPEFVRELRRAGGASSRELTDMRDDGTRLQLVVTALRTRLNPLRFRGFVVDNSARADREERLRESLGEMRHRAKNMLAVVRSLARQIANSSDSLETFDRRFSDRLLALSAAQDVLMRQNWTDASLREVVAAQIAHVAEPHGARVTLVGPDVRIDPRAARAIGMAVHELATNATKYGALSRPDGFVELDWTVMPSDDYPVRILWRECGGPAVVPPARRGFGQVVVETIVARTLGASVRYEFLPGGVEWELGLPPDCVVQMPRLAPQTA